VFYSLWVSGWPVRGPASPWSRTGPAGGRPWSWSSSRPAPGPRWSCSNICDSVVMLVCYVISRPVKYYGYTHKDDILIHPYNLCIAGPVSWGRMFKNCGCKLFSSIEGGGCRPKSCRHNKAEKINVPAYKTCSNRENMFQQTKHVPTGKTCSSRQNMFQQGKHVPADKTCSNRENMF
jgi:hypothetical protein